MSGQNIDLIDAVDLLNEGREIVEAAYMACEGLTSTSRGPLQRLLALTGDRLTMSSEKLEEFRAQQMQGGQP